MACPRRFYGQVMKSPYSSPKLTRYNSLSDLPDHIKQAIASADKKIYIVSNGGPHGLQCAVCGRTFYAGTAKAVNEDFDKHVCGEQPAKEKPA